MALPLYLAMTAGEIAREPMPEHPGYMACHFSYYGRGLCDLPRDLPKGSLLILDDRTPVWNHDAQLVARQLAETAERLECSACLLDLQRAGNALSAAITKAAVQALPCPVAVTECYARDVNCAVLLCPAQPNLPLREAAERWTGRELWLEAALESVRYTITSRQSRCDPIPYQLPSEPCHCHERLCCSYHIALSDEQAVFTISRTPRDLEKLLEQAECLGFTGAVGLYQQLSENACQAGSR